MKIAVYGANGPIGSAIAAEATRRGHEVTAISRGDNASVSAAVHLRGDGADGGQVAEVSASHDVVVSAIGFGPDPVDFLRPVLGLVQNVGSTRLVVVGGAGSLRSESGLRLVDLAEFPAEWRPSALVLAATLDVLRASKDLNWTFVSPAPYIGPGERTGNYVLGADEPAGEKVSIEDYAVALVDELEQPKHEQARFTVANAA
jgi:putative NADH-flavin reductase